jgi:hypothetical protein
MTIVRTSQRRRMVLVAGGLAVTLVAGACGDDDDDDTAAQTTAATTGTTAPGGAAGDDFCTAGPQVDAALAPEEPDPAEIERAVAAAEAAAPAEIAEEVTTAVEAVRQALATQDFAGFESPEVEKALTTINDYYVSDCGFTEIAITAVDYEFEQVPESVGSGPALLRLSNTGEELHEAIVFRIHDDVDQSIEELLELPEAEAEAMVDEVGAAFAFPGDASATTLTLDQPGRYAMVCFIPEGTTPEAAAESEESEEFEQSGPTTTGSATTGGTTGTGAGGEGSEGGPPHFTLGMASEFMVE